MRRTLLLGVLLGVLISAVAAFALVSTLPSDEDIQKMSYEELHITELVQQNPLLSRFLDAIIQPVQERIRDRVIDDVYRSVALAAGLVIVVTAGGVVLIAADSRRRASGSGGNSDQGSPPAS
jgi:hypothetical protein